MEMPWDIIINGIVGLGTGIIGFLTGKERNKKETESVIIQNVENAIAIYKTMLDDIVKRYDSEINYLKEKIASYEKHITSLENKLKTITKK